MMRQIELHKFQLLQIPPLLTAKLRLLLFKHYVCVIWYIDRTAAEVWMVIGANKVSLKRPKKPCVCNMRIIDEE